MIPQVTTTFALTVHYGDPVPTRRLIGQLLGSTQVPDHIVVVNHADTGPVLLTAHPRVLVVSQENRGYMAGLAAGFTAVHEKMNPQDIIIGMNNDVSLLPETIERVCQWWNQHPQPALAGAKIGHVNMLTGRAHLPDGQARLAPAPPTVLTLPYVHGSFLTARASIFAQLKLPTNLWLYWEDVVLSWRALQAGVPLKVLPDIGVTHRDEQDHMSDEKLYYLVRSGAYAMRHDTSGIWKAYWRLMNLARQWYHRQAGHTIIARALHDAMKERSNQ